jgi:hypothetical protein
MTPTSENDVKADEEQQSGSMANNGDEASDDDPNE